MRKNYNYEYLVINDLLRNNKINIPKIKKKLTKTNNIDKYMYGYNSFNIMSINGFINILISSLTSSFLSISKHLRKNGSITTINNDFIC